MTNRNEVEGVEYVVPNPRDFTIGHVEIWERWYKEDGKVIYEWKRPTDNEWIRKVTAHKETPWIMKTYLNQREYEQRLLSSSVLKSAPNTKPLNK